MSTFFSIDVEADGPIPGKYSMVCFGAVVVEPSLKKTFYGQIKPVSDEYIPDALAVSGFSREDHEKFDEPEKVMKDFVKWVRENTKGTPIFISDNNGFDWMFMCYYMWYYAGENPFGWSSRRISDLWSGFTNDMHVKWKWMRKTSHTHNPVDDAKGNAESLLEMQKRGLNIKLI